MGEVKRTAPTAKSEADVVCDCIGERSFQVSADWFNELMPDELKITRQTIWNWVVGKTEPNGTVLQAYVLAYAENDPRRVMAQTILDMRIDYLMEFFEEMNHG
jgi:hypothetical protein